MKKPTLSKGASDKQKLLDRKKEAVRDVFRQAAKAKSRDSVGNRSNSFANSTKSPKGLLSTKILEESTGTKLNAKRSSIKTN